MRATLSLSPVLLLTVLFLPPAHGLPWRGKKPAYAALFKPGRRRYQLVYTKHPLDARRTKKKVTRHRVTCRVGAARRLRDAWVSSMRCKGGGKATTFGALTFIANRESLWIVEGVCDDKCVAKTLGKPRTLARNQKPYKTEGNLDTYDTPREADGSTVTIRRQHKRVGRRKVKVWCRIIGRRLTHSHSETTTYCLNARHGLVSKEHDESYGPRGPYSLFSTTLALER